MTLFVTNCFCSIKKLEFMFRTYSLLLVILGFINLGYSQVMPEDIVKWDFSVQQNGCDATVIGKINIQNGWHINALVLSEESFAIPTTFKVHPSKNYELVGGVIAPKPKEGYLEAIDEVTTYFEGSFTFKQKIKVTSENDFNLNLDFGFQTCDSVNCLFPYEETFTVKVKGCDDLSSSVQENNENIDDNEDFEEVMMADDSSWFAGEGEEMTNASSEESNVVEPDTKQKANIEDYSLWGIFFLAFGFGLLALLTPCVFPMIPLTVSFFTGKSKTKTQGIGNALKYGLSIIAIYVVLGTAVAAIFGAEALNSLSTDPILNVVFFVIFVVFAVSFMGAFEITLPSSWANKSDEKADKGGFFGIFFMALALAIVSFSCTGPIVGLILVHSATAGVGAAPIIGMLGFSLALALPFALFAAFPSWLDSLPKSGGWMNTVKVVLGLIELAFAFKFLSNADLTLQLGWLKRELFLAIWIGIFIVLALYLFGLFRLPNDSKTDKISVGRSLLGTFSIIFVIYLIPGMWGAPLEIISGFPPPMSYSESPLGVGKSSGEISYGISDRNSAGFVEGMYLGPQNIMVFHDYDKALAHAKNVDKPLFVDFTGWACVNCRKMEENVWGKPGVIDYLRDSVVIVSLHVDERTLLPKEEQIEVTYPNGRVKTLRTIGDKWAYKEITEYGVATQPYYILQDTNGNDIGNGPANYLNHGNQRAFFEWLENGLTLWRKEK